MATSASSTTTSLHSDMIDSKVIQLFFLVVVAVETKMNKKNKKKQKTKLRRWNTKVKYRKKRLYITVKAVKCPTDHQTNSKLTFCSFEKSWLFKPYHDWDRGSYTGCYHDDDDEAELASIIDKDWKEFKVEN